MSRGVGGEIGVALVGAGGFGRRLGVAVQSVPGLRLVAVQEALSFRKIPVKPGQPGIARGLPGTLANRQHSETGRCHPRFLRPRDDQIDPPSVHANIYSAQRRDSVHKE